MNHSFELISDRLRPGTRAWLRIERCLNLLMAWETRYRQRRELLELDDVSLRDIGVSRVDALREAGKPFWQA